MRALHALGCTLSTKPPKTTTPNPNKMWSSVNGGIVVSVSSLQQIYHHKLQDNRDNVVVVHTFDPSNEGAEAGESL